MKIYFVFFILFVSFFSLNECKKKRKFSGIFTKRNIQPIRKGSDIDKVRRMKVV